MVYVISKQGKPLMPTERHGKVKHLLRQGKAKVLTTKPFTIQLLYDSTEHVQPVTLGIDTGYLNMGFSAVSGGKELISGEVRLLKGMSGRIYERSMYRRPRRNRLRHRRNKGKLHTKPKGWLAPSIEHKVDSQVRFITNKLAKILPEPKVIVEIANFDIQRLMNPDIEGKEYQQGKQYGHINVRQYVFHRDNYKCQNPKCKNKDPKPTLIAHHLRYRKGGGTGRPDDQITLCSQCHSSASHKSFLKDWKPKTKGFKAETFMTATYRMLIERLTALGFDTDYTYGYITKADREALGLEKTHANDAFCIAGGTNQTRIEPLTYQQTRRNNRNLERFYDAIYIDTRTGKKASGSELCSGRTTRNKNKNGENLRVYRGKKTREGRRSIRKQRYPYQPNDLVWYDGKIHTVKGTQNEGQYVALREIKKVPRIDLLMPYRYSKGFACIAN